MTEKRQYSGLGDWLEDVQQSQRWLMGELKEQNPSTINGYVKWRSSIPTRHHKKLRELGYSGPFKKGAANPDSLDLNGLRDEIQGYVEHVKGYMDAKFRDGHDERETLAEILRAMAERIEDVAEKVGLEPIRAGHVSRKKG